MRPADDIIKELQGTALTEKQAALLKELSNTLGSSSKVLKNEIAQLVEIKRGSRSEMSIEEFLDILFSAGNEI